MSKEKVKKDALDDVEFMELLQAFRDTERAADAAKRKVLVAKLDDVKSYIRKNVKNIKEDR